MKDHDPTHRSPNANRLYAMGRAIGRLLSGREVPESKPDPEPVELTRRRTLDNGRALSLVEIPKQEGEVALKKLLPNNSEKQTVISYMGSSYSSSATPGDTFVIRSEPGDGDRPTLVVYHVDVSEPELHVTVVDPFKAFVSGYAAVNLTGIKTGDYWQHLNMIYMLGPEDAMENTDDGQKNQTPIVGLPDVVRRAIDAVDENGMIARYEDDFTRSEEY